MFYALATNNAGMESRVKKAIMLAPCLYTVSGSEDTMGDAVAMSTTFRGEGVYLTGGPNKEVEKKKVCEGTTADVTAAQREIACGYATMMNDFSTMPLKASENFGQIAASGDRFQEYVEDFGPDNKESALLSPGLGQATVPVRMVQSLKDTLCPPEKTKQIIRELGGDKVNYFEVPDPEATHEYVFTGAGNPDMLKILRDELESETYENMLDSAFALTATSAVIATITALSF